MDVIRRSACGRHEWDIDSHTRTDRTEVFNLQGTWPVYSGEDCRLIGSLGYVRTHLFSTQNHYDPSQAFFNPDYYSYLTHTLQTQWTVLLGEAPWTLQWNGSISRQHYSDRVIQDSAGVYDSALTNVDYATTGFSVSYPIAKGFSIKASTAFGWNNSNNTDVQVYQYHYTTESYLFGFTYAY